MLHAIWVFAISPIRRTPTWLGIGSPPGFGTERPKKCGWVEGPCAHLKIIGLMNDAALLSPKVMQGKDKILEGHEESSR